MENLKRYTNFLNELMSEPEEIDPFKILSNIYNYAPMNWRTLGAMEGLLLSFGVLRPGVSFDYKKVDRKLLGLIPIKDKETYKEYIIRKVEEYLASRYDDSFEKRKF